MNMIQQHRGLFIFEGILFILLGIIGIVLPGLMTLGVELFIGILFIIAGVIQFFRMFQTTGVPGFLLFLLGAVLYLAAGILLLVYPLRGVLTLTLILSFLFFLQGIIQIVMGFRFRPAKNWGWFIVSGIISLILALIIWSGFPGTAVWMIGLLVGINLLFAGFSLLFVASDKEI